MDEMYIKMCKEAKEIQDNWEPKKGDTIYYVKKKLIEPVTMADKELKNRFGYHYKQMGFWLPRQEDLQKIAIKYLRKEDKKNGGDPEGWDNIFLQDAFWHWFREFEDMNFSELWLCFVMETCYQKQWNTETQTWETTQ